MQLRKPWKTLADVKKVSVVSTNYRKKAGFEPRQIGGHAWGKVFVGRLKFTDGAAHRVAIKRFHDSLPQIESRDYAARYNKCIEDLAVAGVRLPKMSMVLVPKGTFPEMKTDEWVLVSQLFGSTVKGSKIQGKSFFFLHSNEAKMEAIEELTKVANAGYLPPSDLIEPFIEKPKSIMPIDLDAVVMNGKVSINERANRIIGLAAHLAHMHTSEQKVLVEHAMKIASAELKAALNKKLAVKNQIKEN